MRSKTDFDADPKKKRYTVKVEAARCHIYLKGPACIPQRVSTAATDAG